MKEWTMEEVLELIDFDRDYGGTYVTAYRALDVPVKEPTMEQCTHCEGDGWNEYTDEECEHCEGEGYFAIEDADRGE